MWWNGPNTCFVYVITKSPLPSTMLGGWQSGAWWNDTNHCTCFHPSAEKSNDNDSTVFVRTHYSEIIVAHPSSPPSLSSAFRATNLFPIRRPSRKASLTFHSFWEASIFLSSVKAPLLLADSLFINKFWHSFIFYSSFFFQSLLLFVSLVSWD